MGGDGRLNVLLDTHIFLWSMLEPARLSERQKELLVSPSCQIWLSPITTWECLLLAERGRIRLSPDPISWIKDATARMGAREAPLTQAVALQSRKVQVSHQDPADRFLAGTAAVYELPLVTMDDRLLQGEGFPLWR
jgi:PIN domain nuclease of toxin-antitoxin system